MSIEATIIICLLSSSSDSTAICSSNAFTRKITSVENMGAMINVIGSSALASHVMANNYEKEYLLTNRITWGQL
jgi:hypothetical protein